MKKLLSLVALSGLLIFASCDKEASFKGDLKGLWTMGLTTETTATLKSSVTTSKIDTICMSGTVDFPDDKTALFTLTDKNGNVMSEILEYFIVSNTKIRFSAVGGSTFRDYTVTKEDGSSQQWTITEVFNTKELDANNKLVPVVKTTTGAYSLTKAK